MLKISIYKITHKITEYITYLFYTEVWILKDKQNRSVRCIWTFDCRCGVYPHMTEVGIVSRNAETLKINTHEKLTDMPTMQHKLRKLTWATVTVGHTEGVCLNTSRVRQVQSCDYEMICKRLRSRPPLIGPRVGRERVWGHRC